MNFTDKVLAPYVEWAERTVEEADRLGVQLQFLVLPKHVVKIMGEAAARDLERATGFRAEGGLTTLFGCTVVPVDKAAIHPDCTL